MEAVRKTLGGLFAVLGAYYCMLSVITLVRLPSVTARWVERSGDPDFKYDYQTFMVWIAIGAILGGAFGWHTAVKGLMTAGGRRVSWLALAIVAPFLHWFWFLYRTVGNGVLDREAQQIAMRNNGIWFGTVCLAYIAMSVIVRLGEGGDRWHGQRHENPGPV